MHWLLQSAVFSFFGLGTGANLAIVDNDRKPDRDDNFPVLVAGEVVAIQNVPREGTRATIKIVHVYSGLKSLKGLELFDYTADGGFGNLAFPLLKVGEEGIWLMGTDQNTDTLRVVGRYRKDHTKHYDRRVEWAEAYEQMYKLDVVKQLKLAKEFCDHKTPEVAQLGVGVLFAAKAEDAKRAGVSDFFKELAKNRSVSPSAGCSPSGALITRLILKQAKAAVDPCGHSMPA